MGTDADLSWLRKAIGRGLQGLVALHLDGGPSSETIDKTAEVWFYVIKAWPIAWNEQLDRPRIRAAFTMLAGRAQRWPCPRDLQLLLPAREYPQQQLPTPEYPKEKALENLKKIREMMKGVLSK